MSSARSQDTKSISHFYITNNEHVETEIKNTVSLKSFLRK